MNVSVRQTEDGFVLEGTTTSGVPVRLTVTGLNDDESVPLVITATCRTCGAELSRREYRYTTGPLGTGLDLPNVDIQALTDAMLTDTHQCPEARP